jgi:gas vesicle protein
MNQKNNNHSAERLICSIFFSLFAGVFIGFLFAPKSGVKLRKDLKSWFGEIVERGKFAIEEAKVYGSEFIDRSRERVESFSSKIKNDLGD